MNRLRLTSPLNPSKVGQSVTFTATITSVEGAPPDGENVTLQQGKAFLATTTLKGGTASFTTSSLTVGTHTITAAYVGDVNYDPSKSAVLAQVVKP